MELVAQSGSTNRCPEEHFITRRKGDVAVRAFVTLLAVLLDGFCIVESTSSTFVS